jgi:hypothetical protein
MAVVFRLVSTVRMGGVLWMAVIVLGVSLVRGEVNKTEPVFVPAFRDEVPFATTLAGAREANLPLDAIRVGEAAAQMAPDDSVTALVSHVEEGRSRQWIVHLVMQPLKEKERTMHFPEWVLHTSTGRELRFGGEAAAIAIRVLGPYEEGPNGARKARDVWSGTVVNAHFLGLGLHRSGEITAKLRAGDPTGIEKPSGFTLSAGPKPYPRDVVEPNRAIAASLGLEEAHERAFLGTFPALAAFFEVISRTKGFEEILRSVLDVSWWSLIRAGGQVSPSISIVDSVTEIEAGRWNLPPELKLYGLKIRLTLNDRAALACSLAVTEPRPPLATSAGVVALAAQRPDGKGPHLMIRLLNAPSRGDAERGQKMTSVAAGRRGCRKGGSEREF